MVLDLHPLFHNREEFVTKYEWTLTFLNWRVYKWDLVPIKWGFNWILEVSGRWFYPVKFYFDSDSMGWVYAKFDEITDPKLANTLKYGYRPKYNVYQDMKPFDKEELSRMFSFRDYCNGIKISCIPNFHVMIQHRIWNYDWENIWYMPEWKWKVTYKNGDVYEWEFKKWKPEWKWKLTFGRYGKCGEILKIECLIEKEYHIIQIGENIDEILKIENLTENEK